MSMNKIHLAAAIAAFFIFIQCAGVHKKGDDEYIVQQEYDEVSDPVITGLFNEAQEEYESKYYYEASAKFKNVFELQPSHKKARYMHYLALGRHHLKRGSVVELWSAIEAFGNAFALRPGAAEPYFFMAQAYEKKEKSDYDTPIMHYKKVIEVAPESEFAKISRNKIQELTQTKEKMEKFWKKKKGEDGFF